MKEATIKSEFIDLYRLCDAALSLTGPRVTYRLEPDEKCNVLFTKVIDEIDNKKICLIHFHQKGFAWLYSSELNETI